MNAPTARITVRPKYVIVTVSLFLVAVCTPLVAWTFLWPLLPAELLIGSTVLALLFDIVFGRVLSSCYQSVEISGDTIQGRKLMTKQLREWPVRDIVNVEGVGMEELGLREAPVMDGDLPRRRGYRIEFKDGHNLLLSRHEMVGMDEFLVALADGIKRARAEG